MTNQSIITQKNVEVEEDPPAVVPFDEVIPSEEPLTFQGEDQIVVDDTIILSSSPIDEEDSPVQVTIPNEEIISYYCTCLPLSL